MNPAHNHGIEETMNHGGVAQVRRYYRAYLQNSVLAEEDDLAPQTTSLPLANRYCGDLTWGSIVVDYSR
jgi:hypothetical protein